MEHLAQRGRATALTLSLIAEAIPKLTRYDLEALAERMIDRLDEIAGDPDLEDYDTDLEDDDPAGQCDEDGINTNLRDGNSYRFEPEEFDDVYSDPEARAEHCRRIRTTRCFARRKRWRDWNGNERVEVLGYELFKEPAAPTRRQLLKRKRGVPRRPRA